MPERLGFFERLAAEALDKSWQAYTGYSTIFMGEMIRTFGVKNALEVMGAMGKATSALEKSFGPIGAQLALGIAGTWNGCRFCGTGHLLAANLVHYRETGTLLPLDERMVLEFEKLSFEQMRARLQEIFSAPEHAERAAMVDRLIALELGDAPRPDTSDEALSLGIEVWSIVNECSTAITFDMDLDVVPALSTVAKDKALLRKYRIARGRPLPLER